MDKKVFCSKCGYYVPGFPGDCNAPSNLVDNWFKCGGDYYKDPNDKNYKNNCKDYKEKDKK